MHSVGQLPLKAQVWYSVQHAPLAQLVERFIYTEDVVGSSPTGCTKDMNACPAACGYALVQAGALPSQ